MHPPSHHTTCWCACLAGEVPVRELVLGHGGARGLHRHMLPGQVLVAEQQLVLALHDVHEAVVGVAEVALLGQLLAERDLARGHIGLLLQSLLHDVTHTAEHRQHRGDLRVPGGDRGDLGAVDVDGLGGAVLALHAGALEHVVVPAQTHGQVLHHQAETAVGSDHVAALDGLEADAGNARGRDVRGDVLRAVCDVVDGGQQSGRVGRIRVEGAHHLGGVEHAAHEAEVIGEVRHQQGLPLLVGAEPEALLHGDLAASVDAALGGHDVVYLLEQAPLLDPQLVALLLALPVGEKVQQLGHGLALVGVVQVAGLLLVVLRRGRSERIHDRHHGGGLAVAAVEDGLRVVALAVHVGAVASGQGGDLRGLRLHGLEGAGHRVDGPEPLAVV
eukprot:Colp12_sorted_trinity150504_noHs@14515